MTEIKDLVRFVNENPDDHESRWRLAKKLYMAGEYERVLEHLLFLQAHWVPKVNVRRYLGATYYRLKKYDEAVAELESAVEEWPDELPLREQLARVLEVAGRQAEADHVWQELARRDPSRMSLRDSDTPRMAPAPPEKKQDKPRQPGIAGAAQAMSRTCPSCGAQNTEGFERCWKCRTEFSDMDKTIDPFTPVLSSSGNIASAVYDPFVPTPSPDSTPRFRPVRQRTTNEAWHIPVATAGGLLLLAGIYLTVAHLSELRAIESATTVYTTVHELFARRLAASHLIMGIVLLLAWPGSLWLAATLVPRAEVPVRTVVILGGALASLGYVASWAPPEWLGYLFLAMLVISAGAVVMTFHLEIRPALAAWGIHAAMLISVLLVVLAAMEGFSIVVEYPAMARYARVHDMVLGRNDEPGRTAIPAVSLPKQFTITFHSTGSSWLDAKGSVTGFEITGAKPQDNLTIELKDENRTRYYGHADSDPFAFVCEIVPGRPYQLSLDGKHGARIDLVVRGILRPEFNE
ncbi:MAG TPA: hypothetical protein PK967_09815 [Candidatus Hydrogenedentes bacterium]|nr:hypothetical protein [Candidatus Hydrogenedentota bacterium]